MENNVNFYRCKICGDLHEIDKYKWAQSCIGYFSIGNLEKKEEEFINNGYSWNVKKSGRKKS